MPKTPAEPSIELYPTGSLTASARRVFFATRPKFLTASVLPVLVGTALGSSRIHHVDWRSASLAILATALAHAATNVYNDVGDEINGTDAANVGRIFPYTGGSRFIQNGVLSRAGAWRIATGLGAAALLTGACLAWFYGIPIIAFGVVGLALGLLYSHPIVQLSGRGLGELACGLGLGMLPVVGAAWLQSGSMGVDAAVSGAMVAVWVALILLINEVPDRDADERAGKRTLVVRFGVSGAASLYVVLTLIALGCGAYLIVRGSLPLWAAAPLIVCAGFGILTGNAIPGAHEKGTEMRGLIERTLAIHALGCVLLIVALLLGQPR